MEASLSTPRRKDKGQMGLFDFFKKDKTQDNTAGSAATTPVDTAAPVSTDVPAPNTDVTEAAAPAESAVPAAPAEPAMTVSAPDATTSGDVQSDATMPTSTAPEVGMDSADVPQVEAAEPAMPAEPTLPAEPTFSPSADTPAEPAMPAAPAEPTSDDSSSGTPNPAA